VILNIIVYVTIYFNMKIQPLKSFVLNLGRKYNLSYSINIFEKIFTSILLKITILYIYQIISLNGVIINYKNV